MIELGIDRFVSMQEMKVSIDAYMTGNYVSLNCRLFESYEVAEL